jgi:succinyl-diaminopimelate desuccinylase
MSNDICKVVDELKDEEILLLQDLIQIPSENPPGNYDEICAYLDKKLTSWGFDVQVIDVPEDRTKELGLSTPRKNVIATIEGTEEGRHLLLNAHIDTVPADNHEKWTYPPFSGQIADGRIYGRGATDSKGRLAAYIMAALALKKSGIPFSGKVSIVATCDEETGGKLGAGYVTDNKFISGDMVIVEGYSNQIVRAMAGVLQLKITSIGKPAHAAFKWKGINAIEKMAKVINSLTELQRELEQEPSKINGMKYTTVNAGVINGGTKINVVPGTSEIEVDFRVIPEHSLDEIYNRVKSKIECLENEDPEMEILIERILDFETAPTITDEDSPVIEEIQKANLEVNDNRLPVVGMLGQSDTRWFIKNGITGINFGPGTNDNNLHSYDEFMDIDNLIQTTKVLAVLVRNYVGKQAVNRDV